MATLTFRAQVSESTSLKAIKAWSKELASRTPDQHVRVAYAIAPQPDRGRLHIHALVGPLRDEPLPELNAAQAWADLGAAFPIGICDVRDVYEQRGAIDYLLRHGETWLGIVCARAGACAHRRCRHGRPPWP